MWPFREKENEYKFCSRCKEGGAYYEYGDAGQLCYGCLHWAGKEYRLKQVWLIIKKLEPVWLISLTIIICFHKEIIDLYDYEYASITNICNNWIEIVKSWTVYKP